ncbi:MAG TPA: prolipoprotein diacylglyceryl transferase [Candidatus Omnitrophota bacterium]|nr:prolipoprotein diacylglyceryl transferase [Candidatus Omnitrophota bacterium]
MHRILFSMGPVTFYSYGFCVAIGVALAVLFSVRQAGKEGIKQSDALDILTVMILGGIAGGRLLFVLINRELYAEDPLRAFNLSEGGMAFQGALFLSLVSGAVACFLKKISFLKFSDVVAPYLALAHSVGRIGCFMNGCCYGKPVVSGISVMFPGDTVRRIPIQLYSSAGLFSIFLLLLLIGKRKKFDGYLLSMYLMMYAALRFILDNFRGDDLVRVNDITLSQVISACILAAGAIIYAAGKTALFLKPRAGAGGDKKCRN